MDLHVTSLDEAMVLARDMCTRYPQLVAEVGPHVSARDVALKIFLREMGSGRFSPPRPAPPILPGAAASPAAHADPARELLYTQPREEAGTPSVMAAHPIQVAAPPGGGAPGSEERALQLWRRMYRQLAMSVAFVSTARLRVKNSITETFAVELDLDD